MKQTLSSSARLTRLAFSLVNTVCLVFSTSIAYSSGLDFVENKGQWNENVRFRAEMAGGTLFLEKDALTYSWYDADKVAELAHLHHPADEHFHHIDKQIDVHAYRVEFVDAELTSPQGRDRDEFYYNYFLGKDRSKWASKVGVFKEVFYRDIYPKIDLNLYSTVNGVKYDFIVRPGGNHQQIHLAFDGTDGISIHEGQLKISTSLGEVSELRPHVYQEWGSSIHLVETQWKLDQNIASFQIIGDYDPTIPLIIDPEVIFSTYSGSQANNFGYTATFDSKGNGYAGGSAFGTPGSDYPTTLGAFQVNYGGGTVDMGITKYAADGSIRLYSTYLGGNNTELPHSFFVNTNDELFVFGTSSSTNFPTTVGAYDSTFNGGSFLNFSNGLGVNYDNGSDIVVSRFSADGSQLLASTYIGGSGNDGLLVSPNLKYNYADEVRGEVLVDDNNNCYIVTCTQSQDFPVTLGAFQPNYGGGTLDACIIKLDNNLTTTIWSSYLGGLGDDAAYSVALDGNDNLFVSGGTGSTDFPTTAGAVQTNFNGGRADAFVTHINQDGQSIIRSSLWGTSAYDQSFFVELDGEENVFLLGQAEFSGSSFIQNAAFNVPNGGQFISKFNNDLSSIIWSTSLGLGDGSPDLSPTAFLVDVCNKIYVSGWGGPLNVTLGSSANSSTLGLPITPDAFQSTTDGADFYLMVMEDNASALSYGSYFGGNQSDDHVDGGTSRFDKNGVIFQSVCASCGGFQDFPIYPHPDSVVSASNSSFSCNNAIFKFDFQLPVTLADFEIPPIGCAPFDLSFVNTSTQLDSTVFSWDFGDGNGSTEENPTHEYTEAGIYNVTLTATDLGTCNVSDSVTRQVVILSNNRDSLQSVVACNIGNVQIGLPPSNDPNISYQWIPSTGLSDATVPNPIVSLNGQASYTLLISNGVCTDTLVQNVILSKDTVLINDPVDLPCQGDTIQLIASNTNGNNQLDYVWEPASLILGSSAGDQVETVLSETSTFNIVGTDQFGCEFRASRTVQVRTNQLILDPTEHNLCLGDSLILDVSDLQQDDSLVYNWTPGQDIISGQNSPVVLVSPENSTTFVATATDTFGCTYSLPIDIVVIRSESSSLPTLNACSGVTVQLGPELIDTGLTYDWSPSTGLSSSTTANPIAALAADTDYQLIISNGRCADTIFQSVSLFANFVSIEGDLLICAGDTLALNANLAVADGSMTYNWQPDSEVLSGQGEQQVILAPSADLSVSVFATDTAGCSYSDTALIQVSDQSPQVNATASADTIEPGDTVLLEAISPSAETFIWQPEDLVADQSAQQTETTPLESMTYSVTVIDSAGCESTDEVTVVVLPNVCDEPYIYVPNAFSPNDDGKNDQLFVRGNQIIEMHFMIYDRWGQLVFETRDQSLGWDGTFKGKKMEPAVYAWYLTVKCPGELNYSSKGNVSLLK